MVELMKALTHMRSLKSFKNFCRSSDWVKLDFLLLAFSCKRRHDDTTSSLCSIRCSCPSGNLPTRSSASFAIDSTFSPRALRSNCGETQYGKSGVNQVSIYDASRSMKEAWSRCKVTSVAPNFRCCVTLFIVLVWHPKLSQRGNVLVFNLFSQFFFMFFKSIFQLSSLSEKKKMRENQGRVSPVN